MVTEVARRAGNDQKLDTRVNISKVSKDEHFQNHCLLRMFHPIRSNDKVQAKNKVNTRLSVFPIPLPHGNPGLEHLSVTHSTSLTVLS